ncbi:hypothetical protein [Streptomyces sp. bgisy031]|uniref:hypothetical protein n=1 Tax=Streptomyces sp. bgisy031 TaxID=3413772 RepID=UPI003D704665
MLDFTGLGRRRRRREVEAVGHDIGDLGNEVVRPAVRHMDGHVCTERLECGTGLVSQFPADHRRDDVPTGVVRHPAAEISVPLGEERVGQWVDAAVDPPSEAGERVDQESLVAIAESFRIVLPMLPSSAERSS